jgi:hypothetical protein
MRALAMAIRARTVVRLRFASSTEQAIHPTALDLSGTTWRVHDALTDMRVPMADWGRINVSALRFPDA